MRLLLIGAAIITLATTPWVSSDALIIPKVIILFTLAFFILPSLIINYKKFLQDPKLRVLGVLSLLFTINMSVVIILSTAPWEQEFFGRTGRGLGFITFTSLFILTLYSAIKISVIEIQVLNKWLFFSCLISSIYAIVQFYGIDIFDWRTQTNGIIGTIGNPNFQSSFLAVAFLPSLVFLWNQKFKLVKTIAIIFLFSFVLYICQSTQGYIAVAASLLVFALIYLWFNKSKIYFISLFFFGLIAGVYTILGMLNKGPLSYYLYKVSVRSRGEMWDTAISIIRDNPLLGIGIDSLGDYSLKYQSQKTAEGIAEYIDNVHNFFLQFAATGGLSLALLYLALVIFTGLNFIWYQIKNNKFDRKIAALFSAWVSFQLQSLISPAAIPTLVWNFIICGAIVGINSSSNLQHKLSQNSIKDHKKHLKVSESNKVLSLGSALLAFLIALPLFSADKLAREANIKLDANLAVLAAKKYPESVVRYNRLGADLYNAGLYDLSLQIARDAVKFNPNSYQTWILVLLNPRAPISERQLAKSELMKIDPHNLAIKNYVLE